MRKIMIILAFVAAGIIALSYYGEGLCMATLAHAAITSTGPAASPPNAAQELLKNNLKKIYDLWAYVRYVGILVLVLAVLGFRQSGTSG